MKQLLLFICCSLMTVTAVAQNASERVFTDADGNLRYFTDTEQNHIPDFSHAGYKNGDEDIPTVSTVMTVSPLAGDNTASIQAAVDAVGAMPLNADGIRGAVLLAAGSYNVAGTIRIPYSGVVLRGSGQGTDPTTSTILNGTGVVPAQRSLIEAGNAPGSTRWTQRVTDTSTDITSPYVPAGSRSLEVADVSQFAVGDNVIIFHPSTDEWLASINFGDVADDEDGPWRRGALDIYYNRNITAVNAAESKITLDVPVFDHLDRSLSQSEIYKYNNVNVRNHVGIENLRINVISSDSLLSRDHVRTCVRMIGVDNSWMTDVTGLHFSYALVDHVESSRVSILRCSGLEPHGPIEGGLRYNFAVNGQSNNILFKDCFGTQGRHTFVSNGASQAAGIVWTDSESERDYTVSEGHRRWSQGLLFDNITFRNPNLRNPVTPLLALWNRGNFGTGHGWSSVHSVGWNVNTPVGNRIVIQKPPGRQNYGIGCGNEVSGNGVFNHPAGFIELVNDSLAIPSLYDAQLAQRLNVGVAPDGPARLTVRQTETADTLKWLDVASGETGYAVEVSADFGTTFAELARLPANATSYAAARQAGADEVLTYRVFATGALPSPYSNLVVTADINAEAAEYFDGTSTAISPGGSAAGASTFTLDETCETFKIAITDPTGSPANPFGAYTLNLNDGDGNAVTDFTGQLNVTFRVRSAATVELSALFRSGEGTSTERTERREATIFCNLAEWTDVTFTFTDQDFGADFDPANVRDIFFYLDRGVENFAGNEFHIDHIVAGGPPAEGRDSSCDLEDQQILPAVAERFTGNEMDRLSRDNSAGLVTNFERDTDCGWVRLSVADPVNAPLSQSVSYLLDLSDDAGSTIDLGGCVRATMRVWSAATVNVQGQFITGNGGAANQTLRKSRTVEGGGGEWTELDFAFDGVDLAGTDLSVATGFQFYLDFGTSNFAGNNFIIDDIIIGGDRDASANSTCPLDEIMGDPTVIRENFLAGQPDRLSRGNLSGRATTFTLDEDCEVMRFSVTDPVNAPLPSFSAYFLNILPEGSDVSSVDLTDKLTATIRIWSADTIRLSALFRSGTGSGDERTDRIEQTVIGGGNEWTEVVFDYTSDDLGGLDVTDVIDFWFYLDRGVENFAGNNVLIDDITVGGERDESLGTGCTIAEINGENDALVQELFDDAETTRLSLTNSAGQATTFNFDEDCGVVRLSVTDTMNAPLPPFSPYAVSFSAEENGNIDLTGRVTATVRIWSAETIELGGLFRSGGGTGDERTMRATQTVTGGGNDWTEVTFTFAGDDLGGLNATEIIDFWFYLDRGVENFAGNNVLIDDIFIGGERDESLGTDCTIAEINGEEPVVISELFNSADMTRISLTNTAGAVTTFDFDEDCGYVTVSVTDTANAPLPAFSPYSVDLSDTDGANANLTGQVTATVRLWSAETIELSGLFRSGEGTGDERTIRAAQTVTGSGSEWTEVTFTFTGDDLGGLDATDVTDFWFYLDRGTENFAGNEVIIDDITIGTTRDPEFNSPCRLIPVAVSPGSGSNAVYKLYPTLTTGKVRWTGPTDKTYQVADNLGRVVARGKLEETIDFSLLEAGVYYLFTQQRGYVFIRK